MSSQASTTSQQKAKSLQNKILKRQNHKNNVNAAATYASTATATTANNDSLVSSDEEVMDSEWKRNLLEKNIDPRPKTEVIKCLFRMLPKPEALNLKTTF